jgi:hypothetical protein
MKEKLFVNINITEKMIFNTKYSDDHFYFEFSELGIFEKDNEADIKEKIGKKFPNEDIILNFTEETPSVVFA